MNNFNDKVQDICNKHLEAYNEPVRVEENEWYEYTDEEGIVRMKRKEKPLEAQIESLIHMSHLPREYINKTVSDYKVNNSLSANLKKSVADYVQNYSKLKNGTGLYIYSQANGSGKTHIACACAVALIKMYQIKVKFASVTEMLNDIKESFNYNTPVMKRYQECELLVLDDFGAEKITEWAEETVFTILDYREKNGLPIIYTSNIEIDELPYNNRIKSRIRGHSFKVEAGNEDNRNLLKNLI